MIQALGVAILLFGFLLPFAGFAHGEDGRKEPFELVRSLRALQDQSAHGITEAHHSQRQLLGEIAERLAGADAGSWQDPRNVRAAVTFALSGGDPRVLRRLLARTSLEAIDERLTKGVLAYGEGKNAEAESLLMEFEARSLDPSIAGQIALVQSELAAKKDPNKALVFLDQARLLAPGTLIEEAALRRQVAIVAAAGNFDRFETLSAEYLRRFPNSIYVGSFRRQFAKEVADHKFADDPRRISKLETALAGLDTADQRDIYLAIAQEGIIKGKVQMTRLAAKNAARLTDEGSAEKVRSQVYEGAAMVVTDELERGLTTLKGVERAKLGNHDAELLDAAVSVADEVRRLPEMTDTVSAPVPVVGTGETGQDQPAETIKVVELAQKAIAHVDQLLSEAGQ